MVPSSSVTVTGNPAACDDDGEAAGAVDDGKADADAVAGATVDGDAAVVGPVVGLSVVGFVAGLAVDAGRAVELATGPPPPAEQAATASSKVTATAPGMEDPLQRSGEGVGGRTRLMGAIPLSRRKASTTVARRPDFQLTLVTVAGLCRTLTGFAGTRPCSSVVAGECTPAR